MDDHFSPSRLAYIFEADAGRPHLLKRRESTNLEIKENFGLSPNTLADYGRTLAAFSNRSGGYLVFGIKNKPHLLVGMTNDRFINLDPNKLTQFLNNHFSPPIHWDHTVHSIAGKLFGVIYAREMVMKPLVCLRTGERLREGDIYFRYQGETRLITAADLQMLIEQRIEKERRSWRDLLARTSRISPSTTYLLDIRQGRATGEDRSFLIGEELLDRIKFIHEGRFTEGGDPTLKVIGDVEVVRTEVVPGVREEVPVDPSKDCNLWESDVIHMLRTRIGEKIAFGDVGERVLNGYHIRCVVRAHDIPTPSTMFYRPAIKGGRPQYGEAFVDWLEEQYGEDREFFRKAADRSKSMA